RELYPAHACRLVEAESPERTAHRSLEHRALALCPLQAVAAEPLLHSALEVQFHLVAQCLHLAEAAQRRQAQEVVAASMHAHEERGSAPGLRIESRHPQCLLDTVVAIMAQDEMVRLRIRE